MKSTPTAKQVTQAFHRDVRVGTKFLHLIQNKSGTFELRAAECIKIHYDPLSEKNRLEIIPIALRPVKTKEKLRVARPLASSVRHPIIIDEQELAAFKSASPEEQFQAYEHMRLTGEHPLQGTLKFTSLQSDQGITALIQNCQKALVDIQALKIEVQTTLNQLRFEAQMRAGLSASIKDETKHLRNGFVDEIPF